MQLRLSCLLILFLMLTINLHGQPESEFSPFDWVTYRQTGRIQSITEGFAYIYFATEEGGILRYHTFQNQFDDPITQAQGLSSNNIRSLHFDRETGTLWVATKHSLDYSYTREGNWTSIPYGNLALPKNVHIRRIGSSSAYVWLDAGASYLKLDRVSGISLGVFTIPDEEKILWSSSRVLAGINIPEDIANYTVTEGWLLNGNQFLDPFGRTIDITSFYQTRFSDIWLGTGDGTLFLGDTQMETFYPFTFGLANSDITTFTKENDFWIAGRSGFRPGGITRFNPEELQFDLFDFEVTINMNDQSIYASVDTGDEIWFGGEIGILVYKKKENFWRLIDEAKGLPGGHIITMDHDTSHVWVGTPRGIARIHKDSKRSRLTGIEPLLHESFIYDIEVIEDQVWIGTSSQLYVYHQDQQALYDFRDMGDLSRISHQQDLLKNFWEIYEYKQWVYIASEQGLISYDKKRGQWSMVFETAYLSGRKINAMAFSDEYCFLGTNFGFDRIDLNRFFQRDYSYPFLGRVNDLFISDDVLWLGTNKGLTKFQWTKNL